MRIAIYPGTFDPITNGHVELIQRASCLFDHIIIAVAVSSRKSPYISLDDRVALAQEVFASASTVRVEPMSGLLVDFAEQHKARFILRGVRNTADMNDELQLANVNRELSPKIETLFLPALLSSTPISSSMVREIAELGGDISPFVPHPVVVYFQQQKKPWH